LEKENLNQIATLNIFNMGLLSFLGFGKEKIKQAIRTGAIIIDVRTVHEFDQGKIAESINIPLERMESNIERIKAMNRPVVCCCASGNRSGKAVGLLKANGIKNVYNGGSWMSVANTLKNF
jgi:phage shock protein E